MVDPYAESVGRRRRPLEPPPPLVGSLLISPLAIEPRQCALGSVDVTALVRRNRRPEADQAVITGEEESFRFRVFPLRSQTRPKKALTIVALPRLDCGLREQRER